MKAFKTTSSQLQWELRAQTFILESTEEKLGEAYSQIDSLKKEVAELKEALRRELTMDTQEA
jgi:hypothetical protein